MKTMLYRREKYFHYDFTVAGKRFRGSTGQTSKSKARKVESKMIAKAEERGPSAVLRRAPLLSVFGLRFLIWVKQGRGLAANTRRYYQLGWRRISQTLLMGMALDSITTEEVDRLPLSGSPSYVNQALRTLRRLLGKAVEWKVIVVAPRIRLLPEPERQQVLDPESEAKLLAVGKQPLNDVMVIIQDAGMRPDEVFRIRIENIDFVGRRIFNPTGKTKASRRYVPMSRRMFDMLLVRCAGKTEGWLFPCARAKGGHRTTVAKQFREARQKADLPASLVLYCARHAFGTAIYEETGNLAMVMKVMGHTDVRTAMRYQHPILDPVRDAIDLRNSRHNPRHSELRVP
jgi:integrase